MQPVTYYRFHELSLAVQQDASGSAAELEQILGELSWVRTDTQVLRPSVCLTVRRQDQGYGIPPTASHVFQAEGFCGCQSGDDFYLTARSSRWRLQLRQRQGEAWLAADFDQNPPRLRRSFWVFGLLKLLRPLGLFSLHAAAVISPTGEAIVIVGAPGSGKSTLALGLLRRGWSYVSDDAVLLRLQPEGVEALACRRDGYVNAGDLERYNDLPWGDEVPDGTGGCKRRVRVAAAYPDQIVPRCWPRVLFFARIRKAPHSILRPLDHPNALQRLLSQSGAQLFDRQSIDAHLAVLTHLLPSGEVL